MRTAIFIVIFISFINLVFGECSFGICNVDKELQTTGDINMKSNIKNLINYILGFLSIISISFVIKGGFQILTAAGDDEKVKNGKKTVLFALLGTFIVVIAYFIVGIGFNIGQNVSK